MEVDNSPRPESWKTGVTDSSPVGVMVDFDDMADVLSFVDITTHVRLEPSYHLLQLVRKKKIIMNYEVLMPA